MVTARVDCKGTCTGQVTPPAAKAECQASALVNARIDADCAPPGVDVAYQLLEKVQSDATATASFESWLEGFKEHVSAIVSYKAKLDGLVSAGEDIASNAQNSIETSAEQILRGNPSPQQKVSAGCGLIQLPQATKVVSDAAAKLTASGQTVVDVLGSVGVS